MSYSKRGSFISFIVSVLLVVSACGQASPTATSTPEITPPTATLLPPTPTGIPPTATSVPSTIAVIPPTTTFVLAGKVDVGGYQLNYKCFGEGMPTIIVEAALGDAPTVSKTWDRVADAVQNSTRICIYDRAGIGDSGKAPTPRTSKDVAKDLHTLLGQIHIPPPYILVAHSIGGLHARLFAQLYSDEVAGIVLVDSSHPDQLRQFAAAFPTPAPKESASITTGRQEWTIPGNDIPEGFDWEVSAEQVRNAGSLGVIPLIVISENPDEMTWGVFGLQAQDDKRLGQTWLSLQKELATLSSNSAFVISKKGSHFIQVEETKLVVDEILKMVQEVQSH